MESLYDQNGDGRFILAVFCMDYHSGQWSRGYRILSRLSPRNISSALCEELRQTDLYNYLVERYSATI
jgi:hypothetical protein